MKETHPWIFSNFINIIFKKKSKPHRNRLIDYALEYLLEACPWLFIEVIKKETLMRMKLNMLDFLIDCINSKKYIYTTIDMSEIENSMFYGADGISCHETFIYGYDLHEMCLYAADFTFREKGPKYQFGKIKIAQFLKAYDHALNYSESFEKAPIIQLWSIADKGNNTVEDYNFNLDLVKQSLVDQIHSINPLQRLHLPHPNKYDAAGLQIYDSYCELLLGDSDKYWGDYRQIHGLYDHKVLMIHRIRYMASRELLRKDQEILDQYTKLIIMLEICRNKMIKSKISQNKSLINEIAEDLIKIKKLERNALDLFLTNII